MAFGVATIDVANTVLNRNHVVMGVVWDRGGSSAWKMNFVLHERMARL
jgi:hypothetical protein